MKETASNESIQENMQQNSDQRTKSIAFQSNYRKQLLGIDANAQTRSSESNRNINFYVRGMMQDLVGNLRFVNAQTPVAVTNFVFLDSDFEQADLIGMQLSESFMHEVHKFGIPVIDFKATDYIRVSRSGDFILSKDYLELNGELPIKYVLAGTLIKNVSGYSVNARIVGINSKAVVASAQGFIPESVVSRVMSSNMNDGIPIISNGASY
jgi:TolB-like protein